MHYKEAITTAIELGNLDVLNRNNQGDPPSLNKYINAVISS